MKHSGIFLIRNFTSNPSSGNSPLLVQFNDISTNIYTGWAWFFGDELYNQTWIEQTSDAEYSARHGQTTVVLSDGSIVLMGGYDAVAPYKNDTWRSTDKGITWVQQSSTAGWAGRVGHASVVLSDDTIILFGGQSSTGAKNDVWKSTDKGVTWIQQTATAEWAIRYWFPAVATSDDKIILLGGFTGEAVYNDTWESTDKGLTWTKTKEDNLIGYCQRGWHTAMRMYDNSIIVIGGYGYEGALNDVWRSVNNGVSWTEMKANNLVGWSYRNNHATVAMPDGSILFMGGSAVGEQNDTWRSTDNGATWTLLDASAEWSIRGWHTAVVLPDGSVVLMGGWSNTGDKGDVWRLQPVGSSIKNPTHTYTGISEQTFNVSSQVYNPNKYNNLIKHNNITLV